MKKKKEKYFLNKKLWWAMIFIFIALIVILALLFLLRDEKPEYKIYFEIFINIAVVIISIVGTSIISTPLIEKKNDNNIYVDTIINDVLSDEKAIDLMSAENKEKMKRKLMNIKSKAQQDMTDYIHNALLKSPSDYYFEECSYIIECSVCDKYIEKKIVKKLNICSYEKNKKIKNFSFIRMYAGEDVLDNILKVEDISVNKKSLTASQYELIVEDVTDDEVTMKKSNYNKKYTYRYKKALQLSDTTPTEVIINYTTRVSLHDKNMCCRVSEPCKKFSVDFSVLGSSTYDICISGFGFMNDAIGTMNSMSNPNNVKMVFDKWIFKKDGVSISFSPKVCENK